MSQVVRLVGVLQDGNVLAPGVPEDPRVALVFPLGSKVLIQLRVVSPSGAPVNLSGYSGGVTLTVKKNLADPDPVVTAVATLAPQRGLGEADVVLPSADWALALPGAYLYDVWVDKGSGDVQAVIAAAPLTMTQRVFNLS